MARPVIAKHLDGIGDLVVAARIKNGFIEAFEAVTYETRLRNVLKALFKMRATAREYSQIKPFTDVAERIQSLLDYRLAIVDTPPGKTLVLTATFDRAWEPYMRLIWRPLGTFLDLLFCNCEDYPIAADCSFENFAAWVREHQLSSGFFFTTYGLSVGDINYLGKIERAQRDGKHGHPDLAACRIIASDPEAAADEVRRSHDEQTQFRFNDMAMEALVALHRLTDHYPADRIAGGDGRFLLRASQDLLKGWDTRALPPLVRRRFAAQLGWFEQSAPPSAAVAIDDPVFDASEVQGGILETYDTLDRPMTHGALLMIQITNQALAKATLAGLRLQSAAAAAPDDGVFVNLAFTLDGLRNIGVAANDLDQFPPEFREGMADRGGLIGDVRGSHARRWTLPRRWTTTGQRAARARVDLSEIDLVIQLRTSAPGYPGHEIAGHSDHPLWQRVTQIGALQGMRLLAVEPMRRATLPPATGSDHFGFADQLSQPKVADPRRGQSRDDVPRGEILCGYANARGDPASTHPLQLNGSFLAVRKLRQDQPGLEAFVDAAVADWPTLSRETVYGKLIGRRRNGVPMLPGTTAPSNEFDYQGDPEGNACPFQAHIRRANPRTAAFGRPAPRLMRRGMSFGPSVEDDPAAERGVVFMAYNASLAEQYEVIQRWINGGNSTDVASFQSDPVMGVAEEGNERIFRFVHNGQVIRLAMPKPFVELMWGLYLFAPSLPALAEIVGVAKAREAVPPVEAKGTPDIVDQLLALPDKEGRTRWKVILEDFYAKDADEDAVAQQVWAAMEKRGGALRIPYPVSVNGERYPRRTAVLVSNKDLVLTVFEDSKGHFSVDGYQKRLATSIGKIYLGETIPPGQKGSPISVSTNDLLLAVNAEDAFKVGREIADGVLEMLLSAFASQSPRLRAGKIDLKREYFAPVLAEICRYWFGIPDAPPIGFEPPPGTNFHVEAGAWDWRPVAKRKPLCPADYMSPSRFVFSPDPEAAVQEYGREHGKAMRSAVTALFKERRATGQIKGRIMPAMFGNIVDDDELARTTIGVMTGFLPPTDAALRWAIYDWSENRTLWRIQQALAGSGIKDDFERANEALREPLKRSMQKRPAPDLLWRTATAAADGQMLGPIMLQTGDRIIIGVAGATFSDQALDVSAVFGGNKRTHQDAGHPSHACPAYDFAIGTMLGVLSALLERGRLEVLPAPLIMKLTELPRAVATPSTGG